MPSHRKHPRTKRVFLETYGPGPWTCSFCGEPITELGRRRDAGNIHHLDEDSTNDDPKNLAVGHHACHAKHHGLKNREKIAARVKQEWVDGVHFYRPQSAEVRQRQADSLRGRKIPPEVLAKRSATTKGRKLSDAHRAAIKAGWIKRKAKAQALRQQQQGEFR